jgi:myo-inositol-1(or 4)-monophosphatase
MIETLKTACFEVRKSVKDLVGTPEGNTKMSMGAGGDISRKIDLIAEKKVIDIIKESGKNPTIIGEECGIIKGNDNDGYIIMDAIDGTTNVTRSIPFNCCSLAYATDSKMSSVVDAAIIDIARGDLYYASKDKGAFLNGNNITVRKTDILEDDIIGGVNISGISQELLQSIGPIISKLNHIRVFGANALELCFLARGYLDMFMDLRDKIRPTDMAAAFLIVKEAGGLVLDKAGNAFDSELSFGNRFSFIALSDIKIFNMFAQDFQFK